MLLRGPVAALFMATGFTAALAGAAGSAPPPLPELPGPNAPPPATVPRSGATPSPASVGDAGALADRTKRGVVTVERDGHGIGVGTVLANDGRVLTSLLSLGASDLADIRYADGHVVRSRIGHRDATWDLALLVPLSGRWLDGLVASEADPAGLELRLLSPRAPKGALTTTLKGRTDVHSKSGEPIAAALDVDTKGAPPGAPIVDASGSVVGVVIHACRATDAATCVPTMVGAPVHALRDFLVRTPLNAVPPAPWLGIVGAPDTSGNVRGVRVVQIAPQSPAEKGGLKTNAADRNGSDLIAAVDGQPVETPEGLAEVIGKHAVGESVKLLVFGSEKFREVIVVLRAAP